MTGNVSWGSLGAPCTVAKVRRRFGSKWTSHTKALRRCAGNVRAMQVPTPLPSTL